MENKIEAAGLIWKAYWFAHDKHEGQKRDDGQDYFKAHCEKVSDLIQKVAPRDYNLICAALLHDTVEDAGVSYMELVGEFNQDIADLVMEVTHDGTDDHHGHYFPRLKTRRGILLKFADRLCNLSQMDCWDKKQQEHYLKKSKFWKSDGPDKRDLYFQYKHSSKWVVKFGFITALILPTHKCIMIERQPGGAHSFTPELLNISTRGFISIAKGVLKRLGYKVTKVSNERKRN